MEFDNNGNSNNSKEYKVEAISDSAVYTKESKDHLPRLYYLVFWKGYLDEENAWKLASAVQHLRKLISSFYKHHPDKPIATSPAINIVPPMAKPTIQLPTKHKKEPPIERAIKRIKWGDKEESESVWFSMEPEAGKRPEICLPGVRSIGKPEVTIWLLIVRPRWELNSTLFWPSPSLNKFFLLLHTFGFSFSVLSLGWKVFSSTISTQLYNLSVFLPHFFIVFWRFFIDWSLVRFFSSVSHHWVGRFFISDIIFWDSSASLQS